MVLALITGHLPRIGDPSVFFATNDAQGYRLLADYYTSFGHAERPSDFLLQMRPFLFPVYLGLYRLIGVAGIQVIQILMNIVSLWLVFVSIKSLSNRSWVAGLCATALALTPSFNFIAFHALTETVSIFLICVFIALIVDHFQKDRQSSLFVATFAVSLILCMRPVVLPFWILLVGYCGTYWLRQRSRALWQPLLIIAPILCQLMISWAVTGSGTVASVGAHGFATWFFPVVYGQQEYGKFSHRKTPEGQEGLSRYPESKDKLLYVAKHYPTAIKSYLSLLIGEHLLAGSNFVVAGISEHAGRPIMRFLEWWSAKLSRVFACIHVFMLGVMTFWIISGRPLFAEKAALACYVFAILLILPAALAYWQGDRYIVLAEPLWLVTYGALSSRMADEWSRRINMNRLRLSAHKP
jgi:hypothetical protein